MAEGRWRGGFGRLFAADSVSMFGTTVSTLALQFLVLNTLGGDQTALGLVRGAQWAPYLVFGLVAGVLVDRVRRRPVLIAGDVVSTLAFGTIATLALTGRLTLPVLLGLVFVAGTVTCFTVAAYQSYIPRLVAERNIPTAFARLEQMGATADSAGPFLAGALVRFLTAPIAIVVDAVSYAVSAILVLTIRHREPPPERAPDRHLLRELREGARWVYAHPRLRPYALWLHTWFFARNMMLAVLVHLLSRVFGLSPLAIGAVLAGSGLVGLALAGLGPRLEARHGVGRVITTIEWLSPLSIALLAVAPAHTVLGIVLVVGAVALGGVSTLTGGLSMSYRTVITPDRLRARMNATIRTVNWGGIAVSAPFGGFLAARTNDRVTLGLAAALLTVATAYLFRSSYRDATLRDQS